MTIGIRGHRLRVERRIAVAADFPSSSEETRCWCDAWDLDWPHYQGEHDDDHDAARELRATRAAKAPKAPKTP